MVLYRDWVDNTSVFVLANQPHFSPIESLPVGCTCAYMPTIRETPSRRPTPQRPLFLDITTYL